MSKAAKSIATLAAEYVTDSESRIRGQGNARPVEVLREVRTAFMAGAAAATAQSRSSAPSLDTVESPSASAPPTWAKTLSDSLFELKGRVERLENEASPLAVFADKSLRIWTVSAARSIGVIAGDQRLETIASTVQASSSDEALKVFAAERVAGWTIISVCAGEPVVANIRVRDGAPVQS